MTAEERAVSDARSHDRTPEAARHLLRTLGEGSFGPCARTTAEVARLRRHDGTVMFPEAGKWLLRNQKPDGSWGGSLYFPHDRLVCTMAALLALHDDSGRDAQLAASRAAVYLRANARRWRHAVGETAGFGPLMRRFTAEASRSGLRVPWDDLSPTEPGDAVAEPMPGAEQAPADAAARWAGTGDQSSLRYLLGVAAHCLDGGFPSAYPTKAFELPSLLDYLRRGRLLPGFGAAAARRLRDLATGPRDKAISATVLLLAGHAVDELLRGLADHAGRGDSVTVDARLLEAFGYRPTGFRPQIDKLVERLLDRKQDGAWWSDSTHVSPYYATAQVAFALPRSTADHLEATRIWLVDSQHPDGSWGWFGQGTVEETAFAVLALDALAHRRWAVPPMAWRAAGGYLRMRLPCADPPELWVGHTLFAPVQVIRAAVLSAYACAAARASAEITPEGADPE